jgi:sec-independent protein translocase protein TatA
MLGNLNGWHLLILLAVILLLFGAAKLPALAKSVGQSARVFRGEMKEMKKESDTEPSASDSAASSPTTVSSTAPDAPSGTTEPKP